MAAFSSYYSFGSIMELPHVFPIYLNSRFVGSSSTEIVPIIGISMVLLFFHASFSFSWSVMIIIRVI